ncbi:hypothetical protein ABKV19_012843 [Rosa sericea]
MATAPVKPPLHNFPLSFLKWGSKNHTNTNHRYRRPVSAEPEPSDDSEPPQHHHHHGNRVGSRTARHRFSLTSCSEKLPRPQNSEKESEDSDDDDGKAAAGAAAAAAEEAEVQKPWNLRPRRAPASMTSKANNSTTANGELHEPEGPNPNPKQGEQPAPKSMRLRGLAEGPSMEKKEKRKFWIALSKDEIEEDIFIMTGSRPARRPKKRPKNVQKQLDNCFPGLWLVGFSADAYRGADSPTKK